MEVTFYTEILAGLNVRIHFAISKNIISSFITFETLFFSHFFSGLIHISSSFFSRFIFLEISLGCHAHFCSFPNSASQCMLHNTSYKLINPSKIP
jgi:hypothetical protein